MSVMMVQTKCQLNNTELFLKLFHIFSAQLSAKKLETSTTRKQQNLKNGKVRFRLNIDVGKEMEDSSRLNFSCKSLSARAANVDLTESLFDNWLRKYPYYRR